MQRRSSQYVIPLPFETRSRESKRRPLHGFVVLTANRTVQRFFLPETHVRTSLEMEEFNRCEHETIPPIHDHSSFPREILETAFNTVPRVQINPITAGVMVTNDDLVAAAGVQTQLRDAPRFPCIFALLVVRIDRPETIARASPGPHFFFDRLTRNPLLFRTISTAAFDVLTRWLKRDGIRSRCPLFLTLYDLFAFPFL